MIGEVISLKPSGLAISRRISFSSSSGSAKLKPLGIPIRLKPSDMSTWLNFWVYQHMAQTLGCADTAQTLGCVNTCEPSEMSHSFKPGTRVTQYPGTLTLSKSSSLPARPHILALTFLDSLI